MTTTNPAHRPEGRRGDLSLAFVGTYPPRQCGIATFTKHLCDATLGADPGARAMVVAMMRATDRLTYDDHVRFQIRQDIGQDYERAAVFINFSDVEAVSIQHEFGIFGGPDGSHLLDFVRRLNAPSMATLHTVLKRPSESQRRIVRRLAGRCARLVVMSQTAVEMLVAYYGVDASRIEIVPHGIPSMEFGEQASHKARFGLRARPMILTFGLLGPGKGIETMIRAMPAIVREFPDCLYFVAGATHPEVARTHGEEYRTTLEREAERLGVRENVVFRNHYHNDQELAALLQATDLYVTPYPNEEQITSGTLAYAMGAGAAVLSTPYWHAKELLADGRGRLFPFNDSDRLAAEARALLRDPVELARVRRAAYDHTRSMTWPSVGAQYADLARRVRSERVAAGASRITRREIAIPDPSLAHLRRLTDDTGIIQHARFTIPDRSHGYCVDDNARALIAALLAHRVHPDDATHSLITTYLSFLHHMQSKDGRFHNFMTYDRGIDREPGSEDCVGRAIWALGETVLYAPDEGCRRLASDLLTRVMTEPLHFGPRGSALSILGLDALLQAQPDHGIARATLERLAGRLQERFEQEADADWLWFEPTLTYANAGLPLALFKAHRITGDQASLRIARESLGFLESICFRSGRLSVVGNDGWHSRGDHAPPLYDEQPLDAMALVLAFRGAYLATKDRRYLGRMRQSFEWFLGANRLGACMYDFASGGCRDGLGMHGPNENQGAESTIAYLIALFAMLDLAGEGLEDQPDDAAEAEGELACAT